MLIDAGETITGYNFNIAELLWESLQASGSNAAYLYPEGNKRLAMIGDAVFKVAILGDLRTRNIPRRKDKHIYSVHCPYLPSVRMLTEDLGSMDNIVQGLSITPTSKGSGAEIISTI